MKLNIFKASQKKPPLGENVFIWDYNEDTGELRLIGDDIAIEMQVHETDENGEYDAEYSKQVENEALENGFILGIGWEDGDFVHQDQYWSEMYIEPR